MIELLEGSPFLAIRQGGVVHKRILAPGTQHIVALFLAQYGIL